MKIKIVLWYELSQCRKDNRKLFVKHQFRKVSCFTSRPVFTNSRIGRDPFQHLPCLSRKLTKTSIRMVGFGDRARSLPKDSCTTLGTHRYTTCLSPLFGMSSLAGILRKWLRFFLLLFQICCRFNVDWPPTCYESTSYSNHDQLGPSHVTFLHL